MKKLLFAALSGFFILMLCAYVSYAGTTTTAVTPSAIYKVWNDRPELKYIYSSSDSVTTGTPERFKIDAERNFGKISEITFESASPNCDVWLSEIDNATITDEETVIAITDINLSYSPEIKDRAWINRDTVSIPYLYFTIDNQSATITGPWKLSITYVRN